jgi:small subunit ribosomal protein S1
LIVSTRPERLLGPVLFLGRNPRQEIHHLTEENQGGPTPETEAQASAEQAAEQRVAAVAVADEPAENESRGRNDGTLAEAPATTHEDAASTDTTDGTAATTAAMDDTATTGPETAGSAEAEVAGVDTAATDREGEAVLPAEAVDVEASRSESKTAEPEAPSAEAVSAEAASAEAEPVSAEAASAETEPSPAAPAPPADLGPEPTTMEELLAEQDSDIKSFKHGDVVEGKVVRIDKDEILVDIGAKSEGVVSNRELYGRHAEAQPQLAIGDTVLVYVLQPESQEGHVVLSLRRAGLERKWRAMQEQFEAGVIIEAPVIDHNKGGLIVDCGIRGFVPISQIVDFPRRPQNDQPRDAAQEIAEKLQPFVGRKLRLKILEVNRKANRLILSEKVALYEERREKRDELFSSLQVGQRVTGNVRSIAPFGVFIDLGGIDGLVHKSELSWNKVNNPEAGYKVGEEVEAEVIDINHERGRISLSIRRLQPDPWHSTVADFNVGDVIDGTVTKLVNFGAFVRVRDGLEGLIHISELSHQRVAHPGDVVHEGQQLKLKIISLDSERHRLGLSLKQAEEPPARPAPEPGQPAPRGERRPRQERGYSMSDAVQEPEGGIDNTLAAAFAQVREQVAASEEARARVSESDTEAASAEAAPEEAASAEAAPAEATAAESADTAQEAEAEQAEAAVGSAETADASAVEPAVAEAAADETPVSATAEPEAAAAETVETVPATAEVAEPEATSAAAEATAEATSDAAEATAEATEEASDAADEPTATEAKADSTEEASETADEPTATEAKAETDEEPQAKVTPADPEAVAAAEAAADESEDNTAAGGD